MGATPVPCSDMGRVARNLEGSGWDGLAVGEAHGLLPDPYVALALAASATTTLKVGTAVAVPLRHPLLAADAMATLQGVAGGRASFSIGRGDDVEMDGAVASMARLSAIDPCLDTAKPPVNVAATGPRMIKVAARKADGVSFAVGADPEPSGNPSTWHGR